MLATLVAFALAMSLPLYDTTSASAATIGSAAAYEGPTDAAHQSARMAEAMHRQARPAKAGSALNVGSPAPVASVLLTRNQHISLIQPSGGRAIWHSWVRDAALGRAPPA